MLPEALPLAGGVELVLAPPDTLPPAEGELPAPTLPDALPPTDGEDELPVEPDVWPPTDGELGLGLGVPVLLLVEGGEDAAPPMLLPVEDEDVPPEPMLGLVIEPDALLPLPELLPGPAVGAMPPGDIVLPGGQSCADLVASLEPAPLPVLLLGLEPELWAKTTGENPKAMLRASARARNFI